MGIKFLSQLIHRVFSLRKFLEERGDKNSYIFEKKTKVFIFFCGLFWGKMGGSQETLRSVENTFFKPVTH
jgi:hypothetical protein